jgi:hypothetical protein
MLLAIKASYSSSMARRQDGLVTAARTEVGTKESDDNEVANNVSLLVGSRKPCFSRMIIG